MKLTKIKLRNYRCFGPVEQIINIDDLTAFIGDNASGKTAALSALNCMSSEYSGDRQLHRSDFYMPNDTEPENLEKQDMSVEVVFEFDELDSDKAEDGEYSIPPFYQHVVVDKPDGTPYLRIRLNAIWEKSSSVEGSIESQIYYVTCPESESISEESLVPTHRKDLDRIRVLYVPAVRDPSYQLRNTSGTMMYRIMSGINWSETTRKSIKEKIDQLNAEFKKESGVSMFGSSIEKQWKEYDPDDRYSNATLRFNTTDLESSVKRTEVVFLPTETGKEYSIDQMSDGLRSLFYISLVDSVLDVEEQIRQQLISTPDRVPFNIDPPVFTLVALEEPENHIAPHLLGRLMNNLLSISNKSNAQVIVTSHSPAIIKRIDPEHLRYFRISTEEKTTIVRRITLPDNEKPEDQYKYIKEAVQRYPEIYFANLVILGEGDSEEIVLPTLWELLNRNVDLSGISIVPLGGRHVNHLWRLLQNLEIPYVTLLDLDREREGGGWGRIKYVLEQLLQYGVDRNELLKIQDGILSDERFSKMHKWDVSDIKAMQGWITYLEDYGVFFSTPLDIDFLMIEKYTEYYKRIISEKEGPRITTKSDGRQKYIRDIEKEDTDYEEYLLRVEEDVKAVLKSCGGDGVTYTMEQKQLMIWYKYFFLYRGKPSTHFAALSLIDKETMEKNMPDVLRRLFDKVKEKIRG